MNLLMVPSWFPTQDKPANGLFFKEQAGALVRRGHRVAVAYADLRFVLRGLPTGVFVEPGEVPVYLCRRRSLTPFWEAGRVPQREAMLRTLYQRVEREWGKPDVLLLESCRLGPEAVRLARRESLPLAYVEHYSGVLLAQRDGWPRRAYTLRRQLQTTLSGCGAAGAVSAALRAAMLAGAGAGPAPVVDIVPNPVDTAHFVLPPAPPAGPFSFAAMGNFVPLKGFDVLLGAFALVLREAPEALLRLAGDGAEDDALRAQARRLGITRSVRFEGRVPREMAPAFFQGCRCFVCPSRAETFGIALIEAMACGLPVAATRCGGPDGIVGAGDGVLCEPGDPRALADAMLAVYKNPERFDPAAIRERCAERFSQQAAVTRLEALCRRARPGAMTRGKAD